MLNGDVESPEMAEVAEKQSHDKRAAGCAQRELGSSRKRDLDLSEQDAQQDRQREGEESHGIEPERFLGKPDRRGGVGGYEGLFLLFHVHFQDLGNKLYEKDDAHDAERVGYGIAGGGKGRKLSGGLLRRGKAGSGGEGSGQESHGKLGPDSAEPDDETAGCCAAEDDDEAQQDVVLCVALEIAEELGSGDEADRADEAHQSEVPYDGIDLDSEVSEHQGDQQDSGSSQLDPLDLDASDQVSDRCDNKYCQQAAHAVFPPLSI